MLSPSPVIHSALEFPFGAQIDMINACMADYTAGPYQFDTNLFGRAISSCAYDLESSRIVFHDQQLVAFVYVRHYDDRTRIALLGVLPEFRRLGLARRLLNQVINEARQQPSRLITLECLKANTAALAFYEGSGFSISDSLLGYTAAALNSEKASATATKTIQECSPFLAAKEIVFGSPYDLPFQFSGYPFLMSAQGARAFCLRSSRAILTWTQEQEVKVHCLVDLEGDLDNARQLLLTLRAQFHQFPWRVHPVCPEQIARSTFETCGFQPVPLQQHQLTLLLDPDKPAAS